MRMNSDRLHLFAIFIMPEAGNSQEAWERLLWRNPRTLEWPDINGIASMKRLLGFDFSAEFLEQAGTDTKTFKTSSFQD